jgi:hypothetical protein
MHDHPWTSLWIVLIGISALCANAALLFHILAEKGA